MRTTQILSVFPKITVLVAGDIRLDRRLTYDPSLSGPGTGRLAAVSTEVAPGAGGAIASGLIALGAYRVSVLGVVGDDGFGLELIRALEARSIGHELTVKGARVPTSARTRLVNSETGAEDQPRIDTVNIHALPEEVERKVLTRLESAVGAFDVLIIADHAETESGGVVTPAMRRLLREVAVRHPNKVLWVDSPRRMEHFRRGVMRTTQRHADEASRELFGAVDYHRLRERVEAKSLMIDQSPRGVLVIEPYTETFVETDPAEAGAGGAESFSGAAAVALSATGSAVDAAQFGNLVASVSVRKKGMAAASPEEVLLAARG
jgi:bifunctional ADP-heptose synthase (sugar kinase/adenylyltransferase)